MQLRKLAVKGLKVPIRSSSTAALNNTLIQKVSEQQKEKAARIVPWFTSNMPESYFKFISEETQFQHVQAITAIKELSSSNMALRLSNVEKATNLHHVTYINSGTETGVLYNQIKNLVAPTGTELAHVHVFSSVDKSLALNVFSFEAKEGAHSHPTKVEAKNLYDFAAEMKSGKYAKDASVPKYSEIFSEKALEEYLKNCSAGYGSKTSPRRFMIQREMFEKVRGTEGSEVHVEPFETGSTWVSIAAANVLPEVLLRLSSAIIAARDLDVSQAHLDSVVDGSNGSVTMLRLLISSKDPQFNLNTNAEFARVLSSDLKRAKWLDNETTDLGLNRHPQLGLAKAEVITAFCSMLHGPLHKADDKKFASIKAVLNVLDSNKVHIDIADSIAQLFLERFNPNLKPALSEDAFNARSAAISARIANLPGTEPGLVLNKMLQAVKATLRTNFFTDGRYALSMRVDPTIMATGDIGKDAKKPLPFGVFFVHGRNFNAFHNRFSDIARGGLRLVTPANVDQYALESSRQYDEVYGLSHAQELKNKDIPEGGAKGVILVNTPGMETSVKNFAMRKAVKAFTDSMLDILVKENVAKLVDYYKKEEVIYFGPDEQILPYDIDWIVKRAAVRGYPLPDSLMSSKKENGFNHKYYGVTSEGVQVFLDVALHNVLKIDPTKQPFTVKITGGPDGDVAGNLMKIMFREYGDNCKVVGVADGMGVAEDPNGLDSAELKRLVKEDLDITKFNPAKLSKQGVVMKADNEEGQARRNTMHNRLKADVFVPAGGRPNTINGTNWKQFIGEDGKPSSSLIVEGANIFTTPEARALLHGAGVTIVKDSSANKCGVMTSSYEVAGCMLLSKEEFVSNKDQIAADLIPKLRKIARLEAELMFREFYTFPGALPSFSEKISRAIAKVADAVAAKLSTQQPTDALFKELSPLIREGLPAKMAELGGDRITKNYPVQYQRNAIACALATKMVYKEGTDAIMIQPDEKLGDRAAQYYRQDKVMQQLLQDIQSSKGALTPANQALVTDVLKKAGTRATLDFL